VLVGRHRSRPITPAPLGWPLEDATGGTASAEVYGGRFCVHQDRARLTRFTPKRSVATVASGKVEVHDLVRNTTKTMSTGRR
jgi:hypothetical protein